MAQDFRKRITDEASRLWTRFGSMNNLRGPGIAMTTLQRAARRRNRVHSMENLDWEYEDKGINNANCRRIAWAEPDSTKDYCDVLTKQWMRNWQVPLVVPFDKKEFKRRVESVKSAVVVEMDKDLARDMRTYDLAKRRHATCAEMLSPQMEKAACTLGILGF